MWIFFKLVSQRALNSRVDVILLFFVVGVFFLNPFYKITPVQVALFAHRTGRNAQQVAPTPALMTVMTKLL